MKKDSFLNHTFLWMSRHKTFSILLSLLAAAGVTLKIWEQDVFWLIREGDYFLSHGERLSSEIWSYTRNGAKFESGYWVVGVLFALTHSLGGLLALTILRAGLAFLLFYNICRSITEQTKVQRLSAFLLLSLYYFALFPKAQIRPDFVNLAVVSILLGAVSKFNWTYSWKSATICLASCLSHLGFAPFTFVFAVLQTEFKWKALRLYLPLVLVGIVMTTIQWEALLAVSKFVWGLLDNTNTSRAQNPEFGPLTLSYLQFSIWGWTRISSLIIVLTSFVGYQRGSFPKGLTALTIVMLILSIFVERALPYALLCCVRYSAVGTSYLQGALLNTLPKKIYASMIFLFLFGTHALKHQVYWGFGINELAFPVHTVSTLKDLNPTGEIFHTSTFGNYLHHALRERRVFWDTREIPFQDLREETMAAFKDPEALRAWTTRWGITTILMPIPTIQMTVDTLVVDGIFSIYPKEEWALVDFDKSSFLMIRREALPPAKPFEYKVLNPSVPPNLLLDGAHDQFKIEVAHCLNRIPDSVYCQIAKVHLEKHTSLPQLRALSGKEPRYETLLRETLDKFDK